MRRPGVIEILVLALTATATDAAGPRFGDPVAGLTVAEQTTFAAGKAAFQEKEDAGDGLGPVFNDVSCAACHRRPAVGGGSRVVEQRVGTVGPGGFDPLPLAGGPLLQTKGIGTSDICFYSGEAVPPAATVVAGRRTTPLFGLGFVEAIPDATLETLAAAEQAMDPATAGRVHMVFDVPSNQTRVGRFGWKAQVATLQHFAGEAYLNEMGVTSEFFPDELCPQGNCDQLACDPVPDPEDDGDVELFRDFMMLLAPPPPRPRSARATAGEALFGSLGCAVCHVPALQTGPHATPALDGVEFHPYSDFLLHDMGALGDGIVQGEATGTEMRTAPLWGIAKQRRGLLHDGRARNARDAILLHDGQALAARNAFAALSNSERASLLVFLKTL
jgi:CxxC motif-containing protein (DUF1111 family)